MQVGSSLSKIIAFALLTGCAPAALSTTPAGSAVSSAAARVHGIPAPASAQGGIYAGLSAAGRVGVYGYAGANRKNHAPICSLQNGGLSADLTVDGNGNLASVNSEYVYIYQGPSMCGALVASFPSQGFSEDVATNDALNGTIVVANIYGANPSLRGDLAICSVSSGCTTVLTNSSVGRFFGVALDKNGDCWGSGYNAASGGALIYFKRCSGAGQLATGYQNKYPGGLDVDKDGNLVAVDQDPTGKGAGFWVYKGCKPNCTLVGGPFAAEGGTLFGHLNANSTLYAAGDYQYGQVDIYRYSPKKMTYAYSFNNGLAVSDSVVGAAFVPRSKEW